jgi:predicted histone-like DNA-binding protein
MGFKYRVKTKKSSLSGNDHKYYAVPIRSGSVDIVQLAKKLSQRSTLSVADVRATIIGLVELIEEHLHQGYSVKLDDLGIFTISASSEGFDNAEDCTPRKVHAKKICFRADVSLKQNLKHIKFEQDK